MKVARAGGELSLLADYYMPFCKVELGAWLHRSSAVHQSHSQAPHVYWDNSERTSTCIHKPLKQFEKRYSITVCNNLHRERRKK